MKKLNTDAKGSNHAAESARVYTSMELLSGNNINYETPLVEATETNVPGSDAIAFQFDVPLGTLRPGPYICQVNVIDDAGGSYSFPRTGILIREVPLQKQQAGSNKATGF